MADPLSTTLAVVGMIGFVLQVNKSVNSLQDIRNFNRDKAAEELDALSRQLSVLHPLLHSLENPQRHPTTAALFHQCAQEYDHLEKIHLSLVERLDKCSKRGNLWKSIRMSFSTDMKEAIEGIEKKATPLLIQLAMSNGIVANQALEQKIQELRDDIATRSGINPNNSIRSDLKLQAKQETMSLTTARRRIQLPNCASRSCTCTCHLLGNKGGRFWGFEYTPLAKLLGNCDKKGCNSQRSRWALRFALTQYGIPFAIQVAIGMVSSAGKWSVQPALTAQRYVVRFTSPGFETLMRCSELEISVREARRRLLDLFRSDPTFKRHVDPSGNSYIQFLLKYPWHSQDSQLELLRFLVCDLHLSLENCDRKFLVNCAYWIGEGRHLDLLETVIDHGFDPENVDSPLAQQWPTPCSTDWNFARYIPDPFFLYYIRILTKDTIDFSGSTPLQNAINHGTSESVDLWISKSQSLEEDRNYLGQSPLHVTIGKPEHFNRILNAVHDLDITDYWGITPLMYATAMGQTAIAQKLVSEAADLTIRDRVLSRDFLDFAIQRGQWELILELLPTIQTCYGEDAFQFFVERALARAMIEDRREPCMRLISLCRNLNFPIQDREAAENNLMHYVHTLEEAQALVAGGFNLFNKPNSKGNLPLFSLAETPNAALFKFCLGHTDLRHVNDEGRDVLCHLISTIGGGIHDGLLWDTIDSIRACLDAMQEILVPDNCRCSCAPGGCDVTSLFNVAFDSVWCFCPQPDSVWALEFVALVVDHRGQGMGKKVLLSLFRRVLSDEFGVHHRCCRDGKGVCTRVYCPLHRLCKHEEQLPCNDKLSAKLEEHIQTLATKDFDDLVKLWIISIKDRFDTHVRHAQVERRKLRKLRNSEPQTSIDEKNDEFTSTIYVGISPAPYALVGSIARYALWLEHDYVRRCSSRNAKFHGQYGRRLTMLAELIKVLRLAAEDVADEMTRAAVQETRTERLEKNKLVRHFLSSIHDATQDTNA